MRRQRRTLCDATGLCAHVARPSLALVDAIDLSPIPRRQVIPYARYEVPSWTSKRHIDPAEWRAFMDGLRRGCESFAPRDIRSTGRR